MLQSRKALARWKAIVTAFGFSEYVIDLRFISGWRYALPCSAVQEQCLYRKPRIRFCLHARQHCRL